MNAPSTGAVRQAGHDLSPSPLSQRPVAEPAHVIRNDAEAIAIAQRLAQNFAKEAAVRDRERRLPAAELDEFSQSGLWAITIPKAMAARGVSTVTLAEVISTIARRRSIDRPDPAKPSRDSRFDAVGRNRGTETSFFWRSVKGRPFRQCLFRVPRQECRRFPDALRSRWRRISG